MSEQQSLRYTCLFGGGAIRGAAHVGAIKALEEMGVEFGTFGGSSVGSIVAALYAVGYTVDELAEVFLGVNFELFRDISLSLKGKFALSKGDVFLDWFRELIEKKFYKDNYKKGENPPVKFKDIGKNLVIITTNMKDFTCCEFSNFETPEFEVAMAVRISCCMPGLMRAVNMDNKLLVDGDLMKGRPMWSLSKNLQKSKDRILEIRLEGEFSGSDKNPLEYVNGMYSCMTYSETSFISELFKNSDMCDYLVINTGSVIVVDFNYPQQKRQAIIEQGYEQTKKYFREDLLQKKRYLLNNYSEIMDYLRGIQDSMLRKKFKLTKNIIAEMYILLSDIKNDVDQDLYKEISILQKLVYSNVKSGLLGNSKCSNYSTIYSKLKEIIEYTNNKIEEIDWYINKYSV